MRKIDWDNALSDEDIVWLRQTGILNMEDRIAAHQAQFDAPVPEVEVGDDITLSALDPFARAKGEPVPSDGAPVNTSPEPGTIQAGDALETEDEGDDYDSWKVPELRNEIDARNELATKRGGVSQVVVEGTGTDGAVRKADLVKALRVWDAENPDALED